MKRLKAFGLILLTTIGIAGCATKNAAYNPAAPATLVSGTNAAYLPDTSTFSKVTNAISSLNAATAPADPYAPLIADAVALAGFVFGGVATAVANSKNKQAIAANAAAQHLATVLPDNLTAQAVNTAPTPAIASAVAAHLAAAPYSAPPA